MKVGCFALVDPFQLLDHQLERIAGLGFKYADITDNHGGGLLGREFGFSSTVSLDDNPADVREAFAKHGLTITSVCAHANLLDPSSPARYSTSEVMKAVRLASALGIAHVITTEGDPKTSWGHQLTPEQRVFVAVEKLYEPLRLADEYGVTILLEPHGIVTGSIAGMQSIISGLGKSPNLGVNLDTGNTWLAGSDPVEYANAFKDVIGHVHWKDLGEDWVDKRGKIFGCGFSNIALGDGLIDIAGVYDVVKDAPRLSYTTLEIGGDDNLKKSLEYLESLATRQAAILQ